MAALLWTAVGMLLLVFGLAWVLQANIPYVAPLLALAVVVGVAKARLALNRAARRIVERIHLRGDGRCLGGFLSVRTWLFVAGMAAAGRWLRTGPAPKAAVGLIYVAVGLGLLLGARILWRTWRQQPAARE
jgi:hypothetical protein